MFIIYHGNKINQKSNSVIFKNVFKKIKYMNIMKQFEIIKYKTNITIICFLL